MISADSSSTLSKSQKTEDSQESREMRLLSVSASNFTSSSSSEYNDENILEKQERRRGQIAGELYSTEKSYVYSLNLVIQKFLMPLYSAASQSQMVIKPEQMRSIFSNIEMIYNYNTLLLDGLENRISRWSNVQLIGDIFLKMAPYFRCYTEYVTNFNVASNVLNELRQKNSAFANYLKRVENDPALNKLDLISFLIMPVQRIPRYNLLLQAS